MKPCSKNRKSIAWLVLDALEPTEAAALREHLTQCKACRRYRDEISAVQHTLAATTTAPDIEASEAFHRKLASKLEAANSVPQSPDLRAWLARTILDWRIALPISAAILALVFLPVVWKHPTPTSKPSPVSAGPSAQAAPLPTIGGYQIAISQSLERFTELLTRQGDKPLPPAPIYTASGSVLPN